MMKASPRTFSSSSCSSPSVCCSELIRQKTEEGAVFTFGEMLDRPDLQEYERKGGEATKEVELLRLFAYGTVKDYFSSRGKFPSRELSEAQMFKLRLLSIVTLASESSRLRFLDLKEQLHLTASSTSQNLESLLIEAVYAGLISGRINQSEEVFAVSCVTGERDVRKDQDVEFMLTTLADWKARTGEMSDCLSDRISDESRSRKQFVDAEKEVIATTNQLRWALHNVASGSADSNSEPRQTQPLLQEDSAAKRARDSPSTGEKRSTAGRTLL